MEHDSTGEIPGYSIPVGWVGHPAPIALDEHWWTSRCCVTGRNYSIRLEPP